MKRRKSGFLLYLGFVFLSISQLCFGQSTPVPQYFGTYAVVDGRLLRLDGKTFNPSKTISVRFADLKNENGFMAGQPGIVQPRDLQIPVFPANLKLVVYEDDSPNTEFELESLLYVKDLTTYKVNGGGIAQTFVVNGWDDSWNLANMRRWSGLPSQDIELQYKPVSGQKNMIVAGLDEALPPGVYRLKREEGGFATSLLGSGGLIFAVEPLREGELGKCANLAIQLSDMGGVGSKYTSCSNASPPRTFSGSPDLPPRSSAVGATTPLAPSPETPPSTPAVGQGNSNSENAGNAVCNGYYDCFNAGLKAYRSQNLAESLADFQAASKADPKQGQPWYWQGIVMLKTRQISQVGQLANVWDKALSLGSIVTISSCHERGIQPCERGDLMLSPNSVSFSRGSIQIFNVPPQQTEPGQIQNNASFAHVAYRFKADGKSYTFDFVPSTWSTCKFDLLVQCPQMGYAEQLILTQYVAQTLPKLASGAF